MAENGYGKRCGSVLSCSEKGKVVMVYRKGVRRETQEKVANSNRLKNKTQTRCCTSNSQGQLNTNKTEDSDIQMSYETLQQLSRQSLLLDTQLMQEEDDAE